jgi:4-hydroxybenzoate polyprenyltransferase
MAPSALLRAALRRRAHIIAPIQAIYPLLHPHPHTQTSSPSPDPIPNPAARRHLITLSRRPCPHPPSSASAAASSYYIARILISSSFWHPLSTSSRSSDEGKDKEKEGSVPPPPASWVERWLPKAVRPYAMLARLDKPIGTWLLAWPCMWYAY